MTQLTQLPNGTWVCLRSKKKRGGRNWQDPTIVALVFLLCVACGYIVAAYKHGAWSF